MDPIVILSSEDEVCPPTPSPVQSSKKHALDSTSGLDLPLVLLPQDLLPSKKKKRITPLPVDPQAPIAAGHPAFSSTPIPKSTAHKFLKRAQNFILTFPKCSVSEAQVRDVLIVA